MHKRNDQKTEKNKKDSLSSENRGEAKLNLPKSDLKKQKKATASPTVAESDALDLSGLETSLAKGPDVSPVAESDIAILIDEYKAALSAKDADKASVLESRIKKTLGLNASISLEKNLLSSPSGKATTNGTGSSLSVQNRILGSTTTTLSATTWQSPVSRPRYALSPLPNVISTGSYTPPVHKVAERRLDGSVTDGLIRGATVFLDRDGDRQLDPGEAFTITDARGNYKLPFQDGTIVAIGGTDIATGLANQTVFTAPAGFQHISPVTTIMQAMVDSGSSVDEAESKIKTQFGLGDVDLKNTDPIGGLAGSSSDESLAVLNKAVQAANTANQMAAMIQGANPAISSADALSAAYAALGSAIGGGGHIDDVATIKSAIGSCATNCGVDVSGFTDKAAAIMVDANNLLDNATGNGQTGIQAATALAKVAKLAQDTISTDLKAAVQSGDTRQMDTLESNYTSTSLVNAADAVAPGDIDGDGQSDSGGTLNNAPIQTVRTGTVWDGGTLNASLIFTAVDPEGNDITYSFVDKTAGNGIFTLDGTNEASPVNSWDDLTATDFATLTFKDGSAGSTDTVGFRSSDSLGWDADAVETTIYSSTSSASDGAANALTGIDASTLFSVTNAVANTVTYWVKDDAGSSHFTKDGVTFNSGDWQNVGTTLAGVTYVAGNPTDGTDEVQFKAVDAFGNASEIRTSTITVTNVAPVVSANQATFTVTANGSASIANLFSISDFEGDDITQYWIKTDSDEGYFSRTVGSKVYTVDADKWTRINPSWSGMAYHATNPADSTETISFRAVDSFGNESNEVDVTVNVLNQAPVVTATGSLTTDAYSSIDVSSVFGAIDPEGDTLTYYVQDDSSAGYFYLENSTEYTADGWHEIDADMTNLRYMAGNPTDRTDTLEFKAVDSFGNENIASIDVNTINHAPVISGPTTFFANLNTQVDIGRFFSTVDPEGDSYTYWVADEEKTADGGYFIINGVSMQHKNGWMEAAPDSEGQLDLVWVTGSPADGGEWFKIRAKDSFGNRSSDIFVKPKVNRAPTVVANATTISGNALQPIDISSLFSVSDIDGDSIQNYWFKTSSDAGYFSRRIYDVDADDWTAIMPSFNDLVYTPANPSSGEETIYFRVTDQYGAVSNEVAVTVDIFNQAPVVTSPTELYANENSVIDLLKYYSLTDVDSTSFTYYLADNSNNIDGSPNNTGNGYVVVDGVSKENFGGWINLGTNPTSLEWHTNGGTNGQVQSIMFGGRDCQGKEASAVVVDINIQASAPVVTGPTSQSVNHNSEFVIANGTDTNLFTAVDAEGDDYTWWVRDYSAAGGYFIINGTSKEGQSGWMSAGSSVNGVPDIKWVTAAPSNGYEAFMIRAVDTGGGHSNAIKMTLNVSRDPVAEGETSIEANACTALALGEYFKGTDPDGDTLTYWVYDNSTDAAHGHVVVNGVSKAAESGWINAGTDISKIAWVTGNPVDGNESIQFKVADSFGNESNVIASDLTLTNQGPKIAGPITFHANQGEVVDLSSLYSALDPEGDEITYRVYDAAAISGNGGHFVINGVDKAANDGWFMVGTNFDDVQWVAGSPGDGDEVFKIIATDTFGNEEILHVDVDVNRPAVASAKQASITVDALGTVDISTLFSVVDPDGDAFDRFWFKTSDEAYISRSIYDVDCDDWTSIQPRFDGLTYTAGNPASGSETLYFKATDEYGTESNIVELTVNTVNHGPTINGPSSIIIAKDTVFNLSDFFTAIDPEGQSIRKWIVCDNSASADGNGYFTIDGVSKETVGGWIHNWGGADEITWTTGNPSDGSEYFKLIAEDAYGQKSNELKVTVNVVDQLPGNLESPSDILTPNAADGSALARTISSASDVDWYALDMTANQSYIFQAEGVSTFGQGVSDPALSLYYVDNATGKNTLVQRDLRSGDGWNAWMDFTPTADALSKGKYYLEVFSNNGSTGAYLVSAAKDSGDQSLNLSGSNLNMWGSGSSANIHWEYNLFDFNVQKEWDWGFESSIVDFGAKPYLEFGASLGASVDIDSGSMNFAQDIDFDFDFARDVTAGGELVIDTSDWATSGMMDFSTVAPQFEMWAGMEVNAAAGVNDIWMDTFWDDKYTYGDISLVDMEFSKTFLNIDSEGIEVLGQDADLEVEEDFLNGIIEVEASIPQFGDTSVSAQKGTSNNAWLSHTTITGEGDNFVTLGLDVDALIGTFVPAADALDGEFEVDLGFLELDFEYTILDMNVNLNAKPVQEMRAALGYHMEDISLEFTTYASQADKDAGKIFHSYSGNLGDRFELLTPDNADGTMIVDVDFDIGGIVRNKSGLQLDAGPSLELLSLEVEGEIFSVDFEASAGPLFEWEKTWDVGSPIWLWDKATHYDSLVSGSTTYTVDYHNRDDMFLAVA